MMRSKREILKNSRRRHSRRRAKLALLIVVASVLLLAGIGFVLNHNKLLIAGIEVEGAGVLKSDDIKQTIESEISGRWLGVIPRRSVVFYPHDNLTASLITAFPRIKDLAIELEGRTLSVTLSERKPAYLWCNDDRTSCRFMDENGFIFDEAPEFSDSVYFEFYGPTPSGSDFKKLADFKNQFRWGTPVKMKIQDNGDAEMYIERSLPAGRQDWRVIFNKDQNLDDLLIILDTAFNSELKDRKLNYVDLRFGRKIFYK